MFKNKMFEKKAEKILEITTSTVNDQGDEFQYQDTSLQVLLPLSFKEIYDFLAKQYIGTYKKKSKVFIIQGWEQTG